MGSGQTKYQTKDQRTNRQTPTTPHRVPTRITSGKKLVADEDGRSLWSRRMRDITSLHVSDSGGLDELSEAKRAIIRRIAVLTIECERMEKQFAENDDTPIPLLETYQRTCNTLRRQLEAIGLDRKPRDINPLQEHIRRNYQRQDDE
jgi:hypothetical protein